MITEVEDTMEECQMVMMQTGDGGFKFQTCGDDGL